MVLIENCQLANDAEPRGALQLTSRSFMFCENWEIEFKMHYHKKTKESGFFEGDWDCLDAVNMGKAMKRTNVFTTSSEPRRKKESEKVEYTQEELETHIRPTEYSRRGR